LDPEFSVCLLGAAADRGPGVGISCIPGRLAAAGGVGALSTSASAAALPQQKVAAQQSLATATVINRNVQRWTTQEYRLSAFGRVVDALDGDDAHTVASSHQMQLAADVVSVQEVALRRIMV
jgi:hypothetical protein